MVEIMVLGALAFVALLVLAVFASAIGLVLWTVFLPFRILGWMLKGLGLLIALPFVVIFGAIAFVVFGAGVLMFFLPLLPFALIAWGAWWLLRPRARSAAPAVH